MSLLEPSALGTARRGADLLAAVEAGADDTRLRELLIAHGEQIADPLTPDEGAELRRACAAFAPAFAAASTGGAAEVLNAVLHEYAQAPRLTGHDGSPWHLHVDGSDDGDWEAWLASATALAIASLLAERQANPARRCAAAGCRAPFVDSGRGGEQRFCSSRCATRARVAAHRRRLR